MHFKPTDQAGLPNFASDKTKPVTTGKRPGKTGVAEWYKREDTVRLQKGEYGKTGYAGRDDRKDIRGQPCAVRGEGNSLSTGGLSLMCQGYTEFTRYPEKQSYRLMTGMFIVLALLQV